MRRSILLRQIHIQHIGIGEIQRDAEDLLEQHRHHEEPFRTHPQIIMQQLRQSHKNTGDAKGLDPGMLLQKFFPMSVCQQQDHHINGGAGIDNGIGIA